MGQNRELQLAQRGPRLQPQLRGEHEARPAVGSESVGRATGLIERPHQLTPRLLAERVALEPGFQLADASISRTGCQLGLDGLLDDRRLELHQAVHLAGRQGRLGHVCVGFTAERHPGLIEHGDGVARATVADSGTSVVDEGGDAPGVDVDVVRIEPVAATAFGNAGGSERSTQPGDMPLQRLARRRRRPGGPQRLFQHVDRHSFADPGSEGGEQRPLGGCQADDPFPVDKLNGADDAHLHCRSTVIPGPVDAGQVSDGWSAALTFTTDPQPDHNHPRRM